MQHIATVYYKRINIVYIISEIWNEAEKIGLPPRGEGKKTTKQMK